MRGDPGSTPTQTGFEGAALLIFDTRVSDWAGVPGAVKEKCTSDGGSVVTVPQVASGALECTHTYPGQLYSVDGSPSDSTLESDQVTWQSGDFFYKLTSEPGMDYADRTLADPPGVTVKVAEQLASSL